MLKILIKVIKYPKKKKTLHHKLSMDNLFHKKSKHETNEWIAFSS